MKGAFLLLHSLFWYYRPLMSTPESTDGPQIPKSRDVSEPWMVTKVGTWIGGILLYGAMVAVMVRGCIDPKGKVFEGRNDKPPDAETRKK